MHTELRWCVFTRNRIARRNRVIAVVRIKGKKRMDEAIRTFANILYGQHPTASADLTDAVADWQAFYEANSDSLDVDINWLKKCWGDDPQQWDVMLDIGHMHRVVFEADHSEFYDQIVEGLQELSGSESLDIDWQSLADTDPDTPINTFMHNVAGAFAAHGRTLIILDKGSDSFPFAVLDAESLPEAVRLAEAIENGNVIVVSETEFT
jgi:hypothetical protein